MDDKEIEALHKGIRDGYKMAVDDAEAAVAEADPEELTSETVIEALRAGFDELEGGVK